MVPSRSKPYLLFIPSLTFSPSLSQFKCVIEFNVHRIRAHLLTNERKRRRLLSRVGAKPSVLGSRVRLWWSETPSQPLLLDSMSSAVQTDRIEHETTSRGFSGLSAAPSPHPTMSEVPVEPPLYLWRTKAGGLPRPCLSMGEVKIHMMTVLLLAVQRFEKDFKI